jgi:N-acetylmuramoyl-L-alanine amidase
LIETGFLTNAEEEKYLKSAEGQNKMAHSILRAFQQYKSWVDDSNDNRNLEGESIENNDKDEVTPEKKGAENHTSQIEKTEEKVEPKTDLDESSNKVIYRVQIHNSPTKISLKSSVFKGRDDVWEYRQNNSWKYTAGKFDKLEDATKLQAEMKKAGFADAFVVAFKNNQRITLQEAKDFQ